MKKISVISPARDFLGLPIRVKLPFWAAVFRFLDSTQYAKGRYVVCKKSCYIIRKHQIFLLKGAIVIKKHNNCDIQSKKNSQFFARALGHFISFKTKHGLLGSKHWKLSSKHNKPNVFKYDKWLCMSMPQTVFLYSLCKLKPQNNCFWCLTVCIMQGKKGPYANLKYSSTQMT